MQNEDRDHSLDGLERLSWYYSIAAANLEFTNWKQSTEEISLGSHCCGVNGGQRPGIQIDSDFGKLCLLNFLDHLDERFGPRCPRRALVAKYFR